MLIGLTRAVSPNIHNCELTFIDREAIRDSLAATQHDLYCAALRRWGVHVVTLPASFSHPDCCFVEDTAVVVDDLAVIASMGIASRRGETEAVETELAKHRQLARIVLPATLEGGDVVRIGRRLFVGLSPRTNAEGIEALRRLVGPRGYDVRAVRFQHSLHLKSGCTAIDAETLLVNPRWVDPTQFPEYRVVATPDEEPRAANTVRAGSALLVQAGFPRTMELLRKHCEQIEVIDISELAKAEAALSCLSILFNP
jgi:dimethylargininase